MSEQRSRRVVLKRARVELTHDGQFLVGVEEDAAATLCDLLPDECWLAANTASCHVGPVGRFEITTVFTPEEV